MRQAVLCLLLSVTSIQVATAAPVPIVNPGFEDLYFGSNLPAQYNGDVPAGAFPVGPPPAGWIAYFEGGSPVAGASIGLLNPGTAADHAPNPAFFPAGSPEGDNAVLFYANGGTGGNEFGVEQALAASLEANTVYTLTAQVGNIASGTALVEPFLGFGFFNLDGFPGYRLQLLAGGQVVAEDTGTIRPGEGEFQLATCQLVTNESPAQLGQSLAVRVVNRHEPDVPGVSGLEVDFDDLRLDASPATVPVPLHPALKWLLGLGLLMVGLWLPRR